MGLSPSAHGFRFGNPVGAADGWSMQWQLKRNCSLAPRQLLGVYAGLCALSLTVATFFWWQGAFMVMPFAWVELLALGAAVLVYARHAADSESIALLNGCLTVELASGGRLERVQFQPGWVRVEAPSADGSLIELSGHGRRIAVGRYVRPELRGALAEELRAALRHSTLAGECAGQ